MAANSSEIGAQTSVEHAVGHATGMTPLRKSGKVSRPHRAAPGVFAHVVHFYEHDEFLVDSIAGFIGGGLGAGASCIVIATSKHLAALEDRLHAHGLDLAAARERGTYVAHDAAETLSRFMEDGLPDPVRFEALIGGIVARAAAAAPGRERLRIFGEMVALLWREGNRTATSHLEELWNDLAAGPHPFSLFCAYPMRGFAGEAHRGEFSEICARHSGVIPDESYTALDSRQKRLRAVSLLQQKAASLEAEIAERKRAEAAAAHLAAIVTSAEDAIASKTLDGIVTSWNASAERMFGYSAEEMIGQPILRLFPPDRVDEEDLILARIRSGQRIEHFETVRLTKSGQSLEVSLTISPIRDSAGTIIGASKIVRDITERKRMEEALRESEERLRFIAESMPQKIFSARPNGDVDYFNPQWMEFTGLSFEEIRDWGWTQFIHPDDVEQNVAAWRHSIETGEPFYCEHRFRRADGVYRWHMSRAIPSRDGNDKITVWIGSSTDIDEQKQLEERKNAFISMASHELKTPVTSLTGFTQILQRRLKGEAGADPQTLRFLERMDAQLKKLTGLIGDLLDVSKIQTGALPYRKAAFDLDELVRETVENVQAASATHRLRVRGATHARIYGDRDRVGQVVVNLLTNAIKYSPQADSVVVRLDADGERVHIAVRDFGIGIAKGDHERIFERLYQVADNGRSTYPGLGIGLYIARTIVEQHDGRIWLESRRGAGSTFYVTLPAYQPERVEDDADPVAMEAEGE
ncbi:MAG TPA: PAS domain S-box protein [Ktedonobacterales bacterium]